jgi:hypothetical protein
MKEDKEDKEAQDLLKKSFDIWRIANAAAKEAQEKNRQLGIPNVYSFNGKIYHENKEGEMVKGSPFLDL